MMKNLFFLSNLILIGAIHACSPVVSPSSQAVYSEKAPSLSHFNFSVSEAPDWTALFNRSSGWFGGDGIFAIPLNGTETSQEGDSTLFIFSDTMVGNLIDGKIQEGAKMTHNSVAYLTGTKPKKEEIHFYFDQKEGLPETIFIPNTEAAQKDDYYWLGDGFVNKALDNRIYIFGYQMRNQSDKEWSFRQVGLSLIVLEKGDRPPFKKQRQIETNFVISPEDPDEEGPMIGAGIFANTAWANVPQPDGYVYIYGVRGKNKELIAARVKPQKFEQLKTWRFWDGTVWNSDLRKAAAITDRVSNELSVSPLSDGRYALVFQIDGMSSFVGLRLGSSPIGPFGPIIKLWDCKEAQQENYFTYNAKAYPSFSQRGELLISYNVNSFHFFEEIKKNPNLYRPRFIKVKYRD